MQQPAPDRLLAAVVRLELQPLSDSGNESMADDALIRCINDAITGDGLAGDIVVVVGGHIGNTNDAIAGDGLAGDIVVVGAVVGVRAAVGDPVRRPSQRHRVHSFMVVIVVVVGSHIRYTNGAIAGDIVVAGLGGHICRTDAGNEYTHADDGLAGSNQHTVC